MAQNSKSTSGFLEDLVRGFVQLASVELHAKTALEKAEHNLTIVEMENLSEATNALERADEHLQRVTNLRRQSMNVISNYAEKLNPEKWCEVKHSAMAMYTIFESYQADPKNDDLSELYFETNNLFIEIMSDFLGFTIEPCASCFSDALKGATSDGRRM